METRDQKKKKKNHTSVQNPLNTVILETAKS